ncbi:GNAT family N-acetyltransferase [Chondrinema litorale]|uniref:GNAT family N-acetyltransferase n=1 Tax=Chondrinema litorale TaxID=2994555 RepID=UPI0025428D02|nr:GNAT family N-acetyltransferase [Chondrinema litorale]UZR97737.1 GNAT family N-acetyltransferase [Chondrinema litorale]
MEIRFAENKDIYAIIDLCKAHTAYEKADYNAENKAESLEKLLFATDSVLKCLVVEADKEIVGYATFTKQVSTWDADYYIYLDCLFIQEHARGNGIGKQIMFAIKDYACSVGCSAVQWQTPDFNKRAIKFYKELGATSKTKERFSWKFDL